MAPWVSARPKSRTAPRATIISWVEYGAMTLDIALRLRVHLLMGSVRAAELPAIIDLTPGIRSLQIHYDSRILPQARLLEALVALEDDLADPR